MESLDNKRDMWGKKRKKKTQKKMKMKNFNHYSQCLLSSAYVKFQLS